MIKKTNLKMVPEAYCKRKKVCEFRSQVEFHNACLY